MSGISKLPEVVEGATLKFFGRIWYKHRCLRLLDRSLAAKKKAKDEAKAKAPCKQRRAKGKGQRQRLHQPVQKENGEDNASPFLLVV